MKSLKRTIITNACLIVIIMLVYFSAFIMVSLIPEKPALKGSSGEEKVGLQIAVTEQCDTKAYIDILNKYGISATFFFENDCSTKQELSTEGFSTGLLYYTDSAPVMSYGSGEHKISTSIDLDTLLTAENWEELLLNQVEGDMLLFITADGNIDVFEKIVQIITDKGYTIVEMEEMF